MSTFTVLLPADSAVNLLKTRFPAQAFGLVAVTVTHDYSETDSMLNALNSLFLFSLNSYLSTVYYYMKILQQKVNEDVDRCILTGLRKGRRLDRSHGSALVYIEFHWCDK